MDASGVVGDSLGMDADILSDGGTNRQDAANDSDCDFNGIWIAKQITISQALELPQASNNWYYLELHQAGNEVTVRRHFDCGIEVRGSLTVQISRPTLENLLVHNVQTGRRGTLIKQDGACHFEMERFWSIRGADEQRFLPTAGRNSTESSDEVAAAQPLPTSAAIDGAIDTENDGKLGVAFEVGGLGVRNSVQRDWTKWFTEPGYEIAPSADWPDDLVVRADFDNEENVIDPSSGLLTSLSEPVTDAKHTLRLRFLGRDSMDPRAQAMVKPSDAETCFAIQDALPSEQPQ